MQDRIRNRPDEQREQAARDIARMHNAQLERVEKVAHVERVPSKRTQQHDEQDG